MIRHIVLAAFVAVLLTSQSVLSGQEPKLRATFPADEQRIVALRLAFSPDGSKLAACGSKGEESLWSVVLWDVASGKNTATFPTELQTIEAITFSPDGKTIIAAGYSPPNATIMFWDVATGQNTVKLERPTARERRGLALSRDGSIVALSVDGVNITLIDAPSGKVRAVLPGQTKQDWTFAFSPDTKILASSGQGGRDIKLWDLASGTHTTTLPARLANVILGFNHDGTILASQSGPIGNSVQLWEVSSGRPIKILNSSAFVPSAPFSPDGKFLATPDENGTITLWDLASGKKSATFRDDIAGKFPIFSLVFSPDGKILASAEAFIKLWDLPARRAKEY